MILKYAVNKKNWFNFIYSFWKHETKEGRENSYS